MFIYIYIYFYLSIYLSIYISIYLYNLYIYIYTSIFFHFSLNNDGSLRSKVKVAVPKWLEYGVYLTKWNVFVNFHVLDYTLMTNKWIDFQISTFSAKYFFPSTRCDV